ncbi:MAG: hypothetical protein QXT79_11685 [Thermofilaceae archaeon]
MEKWMEELRETLATIRAARARLEVLRKVMVTYNLSVPLGVRLTYDVDVELPEEVAVLYEHAPRRVKRVTVLLERGLELLLEGEDGREWTLRSTTLGDLYAIAAVWDLLRRQGIDFLADLLKEVERMVEEMRLLGERFKRVAGLLQVVLV